VIEGTEDWKALDWRLLENAEVVEDVLLTGAGFTRDFGGFLAQEVWSQVYNHPEVGCCPQLLSTLRKKFDYESVYHEVIRGKSYTEEDKKAMNQAILDAYQNLDEEVRELRKTIGRISVNGVTDLIYRFKGKQNRVGFIFTLNQDLFVERHITLSLPWVTDWPKKECQINLETDSIRLPDEKELKALQVRQPLRKERLVYIKLHGSSNWQTYDRKHQMVIGLEKELDIAREPMLRSYAAIFKMVLTKAKRLLVIGYSFRDEHINKAIALAMAACHNPNLELYVVSPERPDKFMERLCGEQVHSFGVPEKIPYGEYLSGKLKGYFPYTLAEVFRPDGESLPWKLIRKRVFP